MTLGNARSATSLVAAVCLGFAALACGGEAAHAQAPITDLTQVPGGKYKLDAVPRQRRLPHQPWRVCSTYVGRFNSVDGALKFNVKNPTKSTLSVTIDANSVDTPSEALDEHLRKRTSSMSRSFPPSRSRARKFKRSTIKTGKVTGNLTLLGVTKPVTLDVTFNGGGLFGPIKSLSDRLFGTHRDQALGLRHGGAHDLPRRRGEPHHRSRIPGSQVARREAGRSPWN